MGRSSLTIAVSVHVWWIVCQFEESATVLNFQLCTPSGMDYWLINQQSNCSERQAQHNGVDVQQVWWSHLEPIPGILKTEFHLAHDTTGCPRHEEGVLFCTSKEECCHPLGLLVRLHFKFTVEGSNSALRMAFRWCSAPLTQVMSLKRRASSTSRPLRSVCTVLLARGFCTVQWPGQGHTQLHF
jgi:hypothetical protein